MYPPTYLAVRGQVAAVSGQEAKITVAAREERVAALESPAEIAVGCRNGTRHPEARPIDYTIVASAAGVEAGDIDHDGDLDAVVISSS